MRAKRNLLGPVVLAAAVGACSAPEPGKSSAGPFEGRGSEACQGWQNAVCDFADRCEVVERAACQDDYSSITCSSDELAQSCAAKWKTATCRAAPPGCDFADMADATPAIAACEVLVTTLCDQTVRCNQDQATCLASARQELDCSRAIGHGLSFESCIQQLEAIECTTTAVPDACQGAIKLR
jgi:hypothetical protein